MNSLDPRPLALIGLLTVLAGCPDVGADDETDSTEADTGDGNAEETDTGNGDGDGDEPPPEPRAYLHLMLEDPVFPLPVRQVYVADVSVPGPAAGAMILGSNGDGIELGGRSRSGSYAIYTSGSQFDRTAYLHDFAHAPLEPAIELGPFSQGVPYGDFSADDSMLSIVTRTNDDAIQGNLYVIPLDEQGPGAPSMIEPPDVAYSSVVEFSYDGSIVFFNSGPTQTGPWAFYGAQIVDEVPGPNIELSALGGSVEHVGSEHVYLGINETGSLEPEALVRLDVGSWPESEPEPMHPSTPSGGRNWWEVVNDETQILHSWRPQSTTGLGTVGLIELVDGVPQPEQPFDAPPESVEFGDFAYAHDERYVALIVEDPNDQSQRVHIADLEGPTPTALISVEPPNQSVVGVFELHGFGDWFVWSSASGGELWAVNVADGIGEPILVTPTGPEHGGIDQINQRLLYRRGNTSWQIDFSGLTPGPVTKVTHQVELGHSAAFVIVPSALDSRVFYPTSPNEDFSTSMKIWANDPTMPGSEVELVSWHDPVDIRLFAPGIGSFGEAY